jgi:hypothetical protein
MEAVVKSAAISNGSSYKKCGKLQLAALWIFGLIIFLNICQK